MKQESSQDADAAETDPRKPVCTVNAEEITFEKLFDLDEIQQLQDHFAEATGVASIIIRTDGTPITRPSNFSRLCSDIIHKTEKGRANCFKSDAVIGRPNPDGPVIHKCLSGGLYDAGAGISVGGHHIASWIVGQVRDEAHTDEAIRQYAREIGADEYAAVAAFQEVTSMSFSRFSKIARMLFTLANQLSKSAYENIHKARYIIESKRAEEERLKIHKLRSIGVLAGGIAHDFNNILTGLFGNIELARMELPVDHASRTYLDTSTEALTKARNLTKQLLTFSPGGAPLLEVLDIKEAVMTSEGVDFTDNRIIIDIPDDTWHAMADRELISHVITNLAINALEAMDKRGRLFISARNIGETEAAALKLSGSFIRLSFRDEGPGIEDRLRKKIFDPYFSTKQSGRGLGLAISHSIITRHHGRITVDSTPGKGCTFCLYIPAAADIPATADTATQKREPLADENRTGHILLMDDEELIRKVTRAMLEAIGCSVETARDGDEALSKYAEARNNGRPFDIAVFDLTIPGGKGGKETVTELLSLDPKAKAIVVSGYSTDPVLAHYENYGFKGRLAKPFRIMDIKAEISRVMGM